VRRRGILITDHSRRGEDGDDDEAAATTRGDFPFPAFYWYAFLWPRGATACSAQKGRVRKAVLFLV